MARSWHDDELEALAHEVVRWLDDGRPLGLDLLRSGVPVAHLEARAPGPSALWWPGSPPCLHLHAGDLRITVRASEFLGAIWDEAGLGIDLGSGEELRLWRG